MRRTKRSALILLVVLGMLSLFSLLAVTYVVFANQSRAGSVAMARRDFRGTPPSRLLDQAIKQVLRGTRDSNSALYTHGLLDDLYGAFESRDALLVQWDTTRLPDIFDKRLLTIPLISSTPLPRTNDALTGRVLTFLEGPLANQSFRVFRYFGDETQETSLKYSLVVDLSDVMGQVVTFNGMSQSVSDWAASSGLPSLLVFGKSPFQLLINPGEFNSHGIGADLLGSGDNLNSTPNVTATGFQVTAHVFDESTSPPTEISLPKPFLSLATSKYASKLEGYLPNLAHLPTLYSPKGDTDERYDAADYQNFFLTLLSPDTGNLDWDHVNPAFHRQAVVNYILNSGVSLASTSPNEFLVMLEMLHRSVARPLSYTVAHFPQGAVYSSATPNLVTLKFNPDFSGGTAPINPGSSGARTTQLNLDWQNRVLPAEQNKFDAWLRSLKRGPWDVDNDGDGVEDSVWVDINLPLMTSAEGKLLKVLAAFYIADMDSKLDINAAGSQTHVDASFTEFMPKSDPRYAYNSQYPNQSYWPQGLGFGTADISLAPLFTDGFNYANLLAVSNQRYSGKGGFVPGSQGDDLVSQLLARWRPPKHSSDSLPGLPMGVRGRLGLALDLLGNPILLDTSTLDETTDDPYEVRLLAKDSSDQKIGLAEWERIVRRSDPDGATLPLDLERNAGQWLNLGLALAQAKIANGGSLTPLQVQQLKNAHYARVRSISPRNVALTLPALAGWYQDSSTGPRIRVSSFFEFVKAYGQKRFGIPSFLPTNDVLANLFPLEFSQNRPLNLNRPLGDGYDNDQDGQVDELDELSGHGLDNDGNGFIDDAAEVSDFRYDQIHQREYYVDNGQQLSLPTPRNYLGDYLGVAPPTSVAETKAIANSMDPDLANLLPIKGSPQLFYWYNGNQPKQLLARHLYCLAQLILPELYLFPGQPNPPLGPTLNSDEKAYRARVLAQWAVNVVDFRDSDAAMTRFPYDEDPFTTGIWNPTKVVFGVEATELVMTEALATHDLRIRENPSPTPMTNKYQQIRIPEGSLFLEFMCTRSTNPLGPDNSLPSVPRPLYTKNVGGAYALDLGLKTPATLPDYSDPKNPLKKIPVQQFPVWRVLLLKPDYLSSATSKPSPYQLYRDKLKRTEYSYQIGASSAGLDWSFGKVPPKFSVEPEPQVDRILWFTDLPPTPSNVAFPVPSGGSVTNPERKVFYRRSSDLPLLQGGQYMVVGPRPTTYFGSKIQSGVPVHKPSNHRIQLFQSSGAPQKNWVQIWKQNNSPALSLGAAAFPQAKLIRQCVTMVAGADVPTGGLPSSSYVGLNISEPTPDSYYPIPTHMLNSTDNGTPSDLETGANGFASQTEDGFASLTDAYIDLSTGSKSAPEPFDSDSSIGFLKTCNWPCTIGPDVRPEVHSKSEWSTAVLQRLADPTVPWHDKLNPYITVDMIPIDLTVFSGEESIPLLPKFSYIFASRQKTGTTWRIKQDAAGLPKDKSGLIDTTMVGRTFFSYHAEEVTTASLPSGVGTAYFDYELQLEVPYAPTTAAPSFRQNGISGLSPLDSGFFSTLGYLNCRYELRGLVGGLNDYVDTVTTGYLGVPKETPLAPYHPNRDFVNSLELTSVPISGPGTLFQEFTAEPAPLTPPLNPQFGYTLDFEQVTPDAVGGSVYMSAASLFQAVNTESPSLDAWKVDNPDTKVRPPMVSLTAADKVHNRVLQAYWPPFNRVSTFREPGRINLNTVTEPNVLRGLMYNVITPMGSYNRLSDPNIPFGGDLALARRGYQVGTPPPFDNPLLDPKYPSEFEGRFDLRLASTVPAGSTSPPPNLVESTLLRHKLGKSPPERLFDPVQIWPGRGTTSLPPNSSFTQYYPAARLANLTTDRSNVFAVRVVLGYFEYDSSTGIGPEYGSEQGRTERHRAFYLIDRSIPVGYEWGKDHNTDKCILLRRIIE